MHSGLNFFSPLSSMTKGGSQCPPAGFVIGFFAVVVAADADDAGTPSTSFWGSSALVAGAALALALVTGFAVNAGRTEMGTDAVEIPEWVGAGSVAGTGGVVTFGFTCGVGRGSSGVRRASAYPPIAAPASATRRHAATIT